ncbi:MAG: glycosyltransferase family 4 protein [Pseudomonadota bacterium]
MSSDLHASRNTRKQRLVFVNRYYAPDHSATAQLLTDLASASVRADRDVFVVTSRQRYDDASAALPRKQTIEDVTVCRVRSFRFGRRYLVGRTLDYASFLVTATLRTWRLTRAGDIVVATTDPPLLSLALSSPTKLRRAKLINWLHDLFPEVAEELGWSRGPLSRFLLQVLRLFRNRTLSTASTNIVLGTLMLQRVQAIGIPAHKIRTIQNWSNEHAIRPIRAPDNPLRRAWHFAADDIVVSYAGNLGRAHDIGTLLSAMRLIDNAPDKISRRLRFLIIGDGFLYDHIQSEVTRLSLRNTVFKPYQPRVLLPQCLSIADIHLTILRPQLEGLIVPSKFYGAAAAGRPIIHIGSTTGEIANVLTTADCGLVVTEGDGPGLVRAIRHLADDAALRSLMGKRARDLVETEITRSRSIAEWLQVFDELS